MAYPSRPAKERFEEKFKRLGPDECWPWTAGMMTNGYGQFKLTGTQGMNAHRAAWIIYRGEVPDGIWVLHHCDNRICVNYERHLFLGTPKDNEQDKIAKGRGRNQYTRPDMSTCIRGHSGAWSVTPNGTRYCKLCAKRPAVI